METNAKLIALAILATTLTAPLAFAQQTDAPASGLAVNAPQPPRPDGPGPRPGKHGPHDDQGSKPKKGDPKRDLKALTTISGTVGQWVGNDDAILDGFVLTNGGTTTTVKFPPHLGQQVQKAIKAGSSVSISGYSDTNPKGETQFRMNSLTAGKTTVFDAPPIRTETTPETPALQTVTGTIADYKLDKEGRTKGFILDNKTIVDVPPHVAYQLTNLAKKGSPITVQGYPKTVRDGQVQLEKLAIIRASVLTINGQQYLVR